MKHYERFMDGYLVVIAIVGYCGIVAAISVTAHIHILLSGLLVSIGIGSVYGLGYIVERLRNE